VLATHDFLRPEYFTQIKAIVQTIDFSAFNVYCLVKGDMVHGFVAVLDRKIEMLFLLPGCIGKGYGKLLVDFACSHLNADSVDVNVQNVKAVVFYERLGFRTYERTRKDDEGRDYPLLRMRREMPV
jgi:putative acetyltransferase